MIDESDTKNDSKRQGNMQIAKYASRDERNTQIIDFNTSVLGHDRSGEHKIRNLNNIINKVEFTRFYCYINNISSSTPQ